MDATCAIQASIHVFSLVRKYVSRILGTYHSQNRILILCNSHIIFSAFNEIVLGSCADSGLQSMESVKEHGGVRRLHKLLKSSLLC